MEILFYIGLFVLAFVFCTTAVPLIVFLCAKMGTLGYLKAKQYNDNRSKESER